MNKKECKKYIEEQILYEYFFYGQVDTSFADTYVASSPEIYKSPRLDSELVTNSNSFHNYADKCEDCILSYECELYEEYKFCADGNSKKDVPFYKRTDIENCPLGKGFHLVPCGKDRVTDGVIRKNNIDNYSFYLDAWGGVDNWKPDKPIFISAQTGSGKNYFVESYLLPHIREENIKNRTDYKVLIICNRKALYQQIKNRIGEQKIDEEGIVLHPNYEFAHIITYHGTRRFIETLSKSQKKQYKFIICDEAHFFTSDAMFNPDTSRILSTIVEGFSKAVRVYMSATPYDCLQYISDYESRYSKSSTSGGGVFYQFKRDYSYLDTKYYSRKEELKAIVLDTLNSGEKWLIFIDDKKECQKFREMLIANDENPKTGARLREKISVIDADNKYSGLHQQIILQERLDKNTQVLISTSVLDNGVNLKGIHNVVISDISKVKCLQMLGRARVEEGNKVNLYIKRFDEKYIERRIKSLEIQRDAYHDFELMEKSEKYREKFFQKHLLNNNKDSFEFKHLFGGSLTYSPYFLTAEYSQRALYLNEIARELVEKQVECYKSVLEEMRQSNVKNKIPGQRLLEYQLSWFGKTYDVSQDITLFDKDKSKKELVNFLEKHAAKGVKINKDQQKCFCKEFTELHDKAFLRKDKNGNRVYGLNKIRSILKENDMRYSIETQREKSEGKASYWVVVKKS